MEFLGCWGEREGWWAGAFWVRAREDREKWYGGCGRYSYILGPCWLLRLSRAHVSTSRQARWFVRVSGPCQMNLLWYIQYLLLEAFPVPWDFLQECSRYRAQYYYTRHPSPHARELPIPGYYRSTQETNTGPLTPPRHQTTQAAASCPRSCQRTPGAWPPSPDPLALASQS